MFNNLANSHEYEASSKLFFFYFSIWGFNISKYRHIYKTLASLWSKLINSSRLSAETSLTACLGSGL